MHIVSNKKMRNEHFSLIQYKDINFISEDLKLIEKG